MSKDSQRMKIRLAPAVASVVALTAIAVIPSVALADTTSASPSASPAATSSASASASASASSSSTSPTASPTAASSSPATPAPQASQASGWDTLLAASTAKKVTVGYSCMLLGTPQPMMLTWTVPKKLVAAAKAPMPAGRTLSQVAHGAVKIGLSIRLGKSTINRLKLVDQSYIGGAMNSQVAFGPYGRRVTYRTTNDKIAPDASGAQTQSTTLDLSNLLVQSRDTGNTQTLQLGAASWLNTNLMIPGFLWSTCHANPAQSRTWVAAAVRPAVINTAIVAAQVTATVRDGAGSPAAGTVTETMTGWAKHKKHVLTVRGALDKGSFRYSYRAAMTGMGVTTAKVQVSFAGRSKTVGIRR